LHVNQIRWYHPGVPRRIPGTYFLRNLIERRSLLLQLVRRDFKQRYVGSAAGWLWGVIHPIVLLGSYYFVFGVCLKIPTENYPLVLITGMLPWLLFSETVTRSATSMVEQANLITKTVFPAEIVPLAIFLSSLLSHLIAVSLVVVVATIYLGHINPSLVFLPVFVLLLGLFAVGIGWIASSLQVYLRDTAQLLTVALTFWLWVTPIFITEQNFPRKGRFLIALNPLAYIVRPYRTMLMGTGLPDWHDLAFAAVLCGGTFFAGGMFFRYMKRGFADVL
jgi:lipopolysaccharide transport system permease protein